MNFRQKDRKPPAKGVLQNGEFPMMQPDFNSLRLHSVAEFRDPQPPS